MASQVLDGFEWLPTAVGASISSATWGQSGMYDSVLNGQNFSVATGRFGYGKSIRVNNDQINGTRTFAIRVFQDGVVFQEGYMGMAMKRDSNSDDDGTMFLMFFDAVNNTSQFCIGFGRNGVCRAWRGTLPQDFDSSTNLIGSSVAGAFQDDAWFYAEVYGKIANVGGEIEVRINTETVLNIIGADTQTSAINGIDSVGFGFAGGFAVHTQGNFDDWYFNDPSGSVNNGFLGNVRVKSQFIIGDGSILDFTIGGSAPAATHWQSVQNFTMTEAQYVYSGTIGNEDLYDVDPIINAPLVHAVQVRSGLRQDDATQVVARHLVYEGGVVYEGSIDHYTNQTPTHYLTRWDLNPGSGLGWTGSEVNAIEVGIKVQDIG